MHVSTKLIPARFLTLIFHLTICIALLWNSKESVTACLGMMYSQEVFNSQQKQLIIGYSLALTLICFELLTFLTGLTMFSVSSALLSIGCHASASVLLCYLVFNNWHCAWYWWIFAFCSVLPIINDFVGISKVIDKSEIESGKWTKLLVLAGFSTTLGLSVPVGYNIGVVNSPAEIIKTFCNESVHERYDVILGNGELDFLWSFIVSIFLVGGAIGSLSGSWLADKIGRKGGLITSGALGICAGILFFSSRAANSVEMLVIGRLLIGLSAGLITCVTPMYLTELAPTNLRGSMGVLLQLGVTTGVLFAQIMSSSKILGTVDYWPHLLAFYVLAILISASVITFLPESPKYLYVIKKEPQLALSTLVRIRNTDESKLQDEINELQIELRDSEVGGRESWNLGRVLADRTLLLPLLLVCSLQAGQQFSGINAVFYYSVSIFKSANLSDEESELATIGAGIINLGMAVISVVVMARFSRRSVIQLSLSSTIICLVVLGVSISYISSVSWMPYVCIVAVLAFVLCYGIGLGPIPYFIGSELFEVGPRPSAMAMGSMANWGGNFVIGLTFPTMKSCLGAASFYIFAIIVVLLLVFVRFYLPETRNKDPSEIALLCKNGLESKPLTVKIKKYDANNRNVEEKV